MGCSVRGEKSKLSVLHYHNALEGKRIMVSFFSLSNLSVTKLP